MEENAGEIPDSHSLPPPQPYPWLVYFHGKDRNNQTFCTISDPTKAYSRSITELRSPYLWALQHGWCLLCDYIANFCQPVLWNPYTLQKISLPGLEDGSETIGDCILLSSPTASDQVCMVLLFTGPHSSIIYWQLGDRQWTKVDQSDEQMRTVANIMGTWISSPVYCKGRVYAMSELENLLVEIEKCEPDGLSIKSTHLHLPVAPPSSTWSLRKLLESNGELFHIEILFAKDLEPVEIVAIGVHRLDFSQKLWEKVESIKDRVLFLSSSGSCFACSAINQETEGGRLYFTVGCDDFMYIYNIEDKSLMASRPFSNLPVNRYCRSIWLMPCKRMAGDTTTRASALPPAIARPITKHLNIVDYLHFRATNRLLRSVAPPIEWRLASAMPRLHDLSLSPLFVYFGKDNILSIVHPKHGLKYKYSINLPEVIPACSVICTSKDGWLLLATDILLTFFFNPFTKEVVKLTNGARTWNNTQCVGFSHPPPSSECAVVEFDKTRLVPKLKVYITRLAEECWHHHESENFYFPLSGNSPTCHHGEFYYLGQSGNLGVLRILGEDVYWETLPGSQAPCTDYSESFLLECNGSLLSVFEGSFGQWVQVFRLDESTSTWVKVEDLGNNMLFVAHTSSFSAVAKIPGMENKIYFPRFCGQSILFYSLETKKYHTFHNMDEEVDFHCTRKQLHCGWICT